MVYDRFQEIPILQSFQNLVNDLLRVFEVPSDTSRTITPEHISNLGRSGVNFTSHDESHRNNAIVEKAFELKSLAIRLKEENEYKWNDLYTCIWNFFEM